MRWVLAIFYIDPAHMRPVGMDRCAKWLENIVVEIDAARLFSHYSCILSRPAPKVNLYQKLKPLRFKPILEVFGVSVVLVSCGAWVAFYLLLPMSNLQFYRSQPIGHIHGDPDFRISEKPNKCDVNICHCAKQYRCNIWVPGAWCRHNFDSQSRLTRKEGKQNLLLLNVSQVNLPSGLSRSDILVGKMPICNNEAFDPLSHFRKLWNILVLPDAAT